MKGTGDRSWRPVLPVSSRGPRSVDKRAFKLHGVMVELFLIQAGGALRPWSSSAHPPNNHTSIP